MATTEPAERAGETDAAEAETGQKYVRMPAQLGKRERIAASAAGIAVLVTGIVAVFMVARDWGPVALLLIGALLLLAGLFGRLPYLKWGDKEIDMSTWRMLVDTLESSPEDRSKLLGEMANHVPPSMAPEVRRLATEAELVDLVRASLPRQVAMSDGIGAEPLRSDGVLIDAIGGKKTLLEIKTGHARPQMAERLRQVLTEMKQLDTQIAGGLLVSARAMPLRTREDLDAYGWTVCVLDQAMDEEAKMAALETAIRAAIARGAEF